MDEQLKAEPLSESGQLTENAIAEWRRVLADPESVGGDEWEVRCARIVIAQDTKIRHLQVELEVMGTNLGGWKQASETWQDKCKSLQAKVGDAVAFLEIPEDWRETGFDIEEAIATALGYLAAQSQPERREGERRTDWEALDLQGRQGTRDGTKPCPACLCETGPQFQHWIINPLENSGPTTLFSMHFKMFEDGPEYVWCPAWDRKEQRKTDRRDHTADQRRENGERRQGHIQNVFHEPQNRYHDRRKPQPTGQE